MVMCWLDQPIRYADTALALDRLLSLYRDLHNKAETDKRQTIR